MADGERKVSVSEIFSEFGGTLTRLTDHQAEYIGVEVEGPYKPESYKY